MYRSANAIIWSGGGIYSRDYHWSFDEFPVFCVYWRGDKGTVEYIADVCRLGERGKFLWEAFRVRVSRNWEAETSISKPWTHVSCAIYFEIITSCGMVSLYSCLDWTKCVECACSCFFFSFACNCKRKSTIECEKVRKMSSGHTANATRAKLNNSGKLYSELCFQFSATEHENFMALHVSSF